MYNHKEVEKKWQNYWEKNKTFKSYNSDNLKKKFYILDMFPYPSGAGLHVGHPKWYIANDIIARYKKTKGFNVLHPMWWDAFWLPAENYAIKTWIHPKIAIDKNINTFKKQINALGFSYDWDREINTTDPDYYKWTQWIFLKLFENGLAYEQDLPINYCTSCKTGLANEEVLNNFTCERCGTKVEKRKIRQWILNITKYAERLLKNLDKLDWPESIKDMQKNWIWKSEWCEFEMRKSDDKTKSISIYTTRIDTVFGVTYAVLAPDYPKIKDFITKEYKKACEAYIIEANKKSEQDRTVNSKEKTWIFTWSYVINPFNNEKVPLWIWDYVLGNYWTWAVMAVPAHDERDMEFARRYNLKIKCVIHPHFEKEKNDNMENSMKIKALNWELCFTSKNSHLINSWNYNGLYFKEAIESLIKFAEEKWFWKRKINYKLRDWTFSRQRYWWEPIPLIHLKKEDLESLPTEKSNDAWVNWDTLMIWENKFSKIYDWIYSKIVCDYNLPLKLPEIENYEPSGDWNSPLAKISSFVEIRLAKNLKWKRETNTMPQWWWSCWYYLRFMDPKNKNVLVDSKIEKYWWQVDSYVGWAEHAVLHLLYARFWHKFLYDIWVISSDEPFYRLRNQGLILAHTYQRKDWLLLANDLVEEKNWKYFEISSWNEVDKIVSKMSKSLKNVVNPDSIVKQYWADSLRIYEMYIAEFKDTAPWDTKWIIGVRRFLEKAERIFSNDEKISKKSDRDTIKLLHKTIKKVWEDIENYKFNTALAQMMILVNNWIPKDDKLKIEWKNIFAKLLHPFAPHIAEEFWEKLWEKDSIFNSSWPEYDELLVVDYTITIWVQVLWKLRWEIQISVWEDKESVLQKAKKNKNVSKWLKWRQLIKEIYVPNKIVNLIVK